MAHRRKKNSLVEFIEGTALGLEENRLQSATVDFFMRGHGLTWTRGHWNNS